MKAPVFKLTKKYTSVIKTEIQRALVHRFNILSYRIGNVIEIFFQLVIWGIIFQHTDVVRGYTYGEMIAYISFGWLFLYFTGTYGLENVIEDQIFEGKITEFLVKPISYLRYIHFFSLGRNSISILATVLIQIAIIFFYRDVIVVNFDFLSGIILVPMIIMAFILRLLFSIILGLTAFWTTRIAGIDYSANVIIKFFSGSYFTLALLPPLALTICKFLPFAYTFYFPTQLFLGKINAREGFEALGIEILWIFVLYGIIKLMWKRGVKKYEGVGI
jgi:ABC-2 type transport system permease protein